MSDEDAAAHSEFLASSNDDASTHDDAKNSPTTRPKPWWDGHPDIEAMAEGTLAALEGPPQQPVARSAADKQVLDDYFGGDDAEESPTTRPKPWWDGHPDIEAMVARSNAEIENRPIRPAIDYPDPMLDDIWTGRSIRELRAARDDLARAKVRYDNAVHAARRVSLSWGQIGAVLGVSRQQLHRRYRDTPD